MGLLARFFKGSLLWSEMWEETWPEILFYYDNFELQATEEEVVQELSYDDKGNKKTLPSQERIREIVDERIKERREKLNGQVE